MKSQSQSIALAQVKQVLKNNKASKCQKDRITIKIRPWEMLLRLDLTFAATLSLDDVKPTNWEICAFC